jgi:hypothetical protein
MDAMERRCERFNRQVSCGGEAIRNPNSAHGLALPRALPIRLDCPSGNLPCGDSCPCAGTFLSTPQSAQSAFSGGVAAVP